MDIEKEEYLCSVSLSTAFDPVNIAPTTYLYDRNTTETWVEKNPRNATVPHNRQPFVLGDITPNVALRAEMRQYFQDVMGTQYTGWEVIPDYPQLLSLPDIQDHLAQVRQFFPEVELGNMSNESWSNAWKRLNYLRLNLQIVPQNRELFLSDEASIKSLGEIMCRSYSRGVRNSDESDLFHREVLRTIRALDLITHDQLRPEDALECALFKGFLLRRLQVGDAGLQSIVLGLLSLIAESLNADDLYCIKTYIFEAAATDLSSTDLKNLARILDVFLRTKFSIELVENHPLITRMQKRVVKALLQILEFAIGNLRSEDRVGIVEDACEAIGVCLFQLCHLLEGPQEFQEARLAYSIEINVWTNIHEFIKMAIEQQHDQQNHLPADHCLLALNIVKIFFRNLGNVDLMAAREYRLCQSFLNSPIARDSRMLRDALQIIFQMFRDFVGMQQQENYLQN